MFHFVVLTQITADATAESLNSLFKQLFAHEVGVDSIIFNRSWGNNLATFQVKSSTPVSPDQCVKFLGAIEKDENAVGIFAYTNFGQIDWDLPQFSLHPISSNLAVFHLSLGSDPNRLGQQLSDYLDKCTYLAFRIAWTKYGLTVAYQSEDEIDAQLVVNINRIAKENSSSVLVGLFG